MSRKNRLRVYNELIATNRLDHDDGALVKEFGEPVPEVSEVVGEPAEEVTPEEEQPAEEVTPEEEQPAEEVTPEE